MSELRLLHPGFLALLALLPLVLFVPRRAKDLVHAALRIGVLALVVLALARPVLFVEEERRRDVMVVDSTASVEGEAAERARRAAERWQALDPEHRRLVLLGERGSDPRSLSIDADGASPLGQALAAASRAIPEGAGGSLTVVSDGRATDAGWMRPVAEWLDRGLPVHSVRLPSVASVAPVAVQPLGELRVGFEGRVRVDVCGPDAELQVQLSAEGRELASAPLTLRDGRVSAWLSFEPRQAGFLAVELRVQLRRGADARTDDDVLRTVLAVQDPLRVLRLGGGGTGASTELSKLLGAGFDVQNLPAETVDPGELDREDLVLLDDVPAAAVPGELQERLVKAVQQQGLGLVMAGGQGAFGPGGWSGSVLEELLPVELLQKEEKRDPSTTLVVIIDTSGSMGGNRVQLAKEVARLSMRRLLPHDKVGIVEFYGAKRWAAPIQPASNAIELERALNRLQAGGGTVILPAIEEAFYGMQNVQTRYKHVLVLTDGGVESGAFEPLLRRMADEGINVSTVLVGPDAHSEFLVTLANWGKGRFYSVPNRFHLPEILLKQPATAKLPSWRPGPHEVEGRGGAGWWGEIDPTTVPPLSAFVETKAREGAEVPLATVEGSHPVLASWRHGLGRVSAFCTTPVGEGTRGWSEWSDYGRWLARALARSSSDQRPYRFSLRREGREAVLSAVRSGSMDAEAPVAEWQELGGTQAAQVVAFRERAPGHFEARFTTDPEVELRVFAGVPGSTARTRLVASPHSDRRAETQVDPVEALDLESLSLRSGGAVVDPRALATFQPPTRPGPLSAVQPLWPWLIGLALAGYLLDLFRRRGGFSLSQGD